MQQSKAVFDIRAIELILNLVAFAVLAGVAFSRNANGLYYSYDGAYALTHARDQLASSGPLFAFPNEVLQSIGNINLLQNPRLLLFFWPIAWFSDLQTAKIASYLIIAIIVFLSAYGMARLLAQPRAVALVAGWILAFVATPFVPRPFFYEILNVAPTFVLLPVVPVVAFALTQASGRFSAAADIAVALGLIGLAFFALAASPTVAPLLVPGIAAYCTLSFTLARSRSEKWRKLAVLAAALAAITAMRWPWYALGTLFKFRAIFFSQRFFPNLRQCNLCLHFVPRSAVRLGRSAARHHRRTGCGPCRGSAFPSLRISAWFLLGCVAAFVAVGGALSVVPHWILPPPVYFEMTIWPLYAVFAAIALLRLSAFLVKRVAPFRVLAAWIPRPEFILLAPLAAFAFLIVIAKTPTASGYPFPPRVTPVVDILRSTIALHSSSKFNGRVATIIPSIQMVTMRGPNNSISPRVGRNSLGTTKCRWVCGIIECPPSSNIINMHPQFSMR